MNLYFKYVLRYMVLMSHKFLWLADRNLSNLSKETESNVCRLKRESQSHEKKWEKHQNLEWSVEKHTVSQSFLAYFLAFICFLKFREMRDMKLHENSSFCFWASKESIETTRTLLYVSGPLRSGDLLEVITNLNVCFSEPWKHSFWHLETC